MAGGRGEGGKNFANFSQVGGGAFFLTHFEGSNFFLTQYFCEYFLRKLLTRIITVVGAQQ